MNEVLLQTEQSLTGKRPDCQRINILLAINRHGKRSAIVKDIANEIIKTSLS